jgi:hypothetical protein
VLAAKEAVVQVGEIPRDLCHPPAVGMRSDTRDVHGAVGDIDEEQNGVDSRVPSPAASTIAQVPCSRLIVSFPT